MKVFVLFSPPEAENLAFFGVFHTKSALTIFTNVVGKAADARTYFFNLINNIQRLTQASQRRQKWRFFPPFPAEEWGISQIPILPKRFLHLQC